MNDAGCFLTPKKVALDHTDSTRGEYCNEGCYFFYFDYCRAFYGLDLNITLNSYCSFSKNPLDVISITSWSLVMWSRGSLCVGLRACRPSLVYWICITFCCQHYWNTLLLIQAIYRLDWLDNCIYVRTFLECFFFFFCSEICLLYFIDIKVVSSHHYTNPLQRCVHLYKWECMFKWKKKNLMVIALICKGVPWSQHIPSFYNISML